MIKFVYFDFGGVLTESGRSGFVSKMLGQLYEVSPSILDIGDYHAQLRRGLSHENDLFQYLNEKFGKNITKEQFLKHTHTDFIPSENVYKLAEQLRANGIGTGLLSNVFAMNAMQLRDQGRYDGFEPIILSCDVGYAKPDPQIYKIAIKQAGVLPQEILFVDDQQKCVQAAQAAGMQTVLAQDPDQIVRDVLALVSLPK